MKKNNINLLLLISLLLCSCTTHRDNIDCLPGSIMIDFIGQENFPTKSLLLRTDKNDTVYQRHIKIKSAIQDKTIRMYVLKEVLLNGDDYLQLKNYMIRNKTKNGTQNSLFQIKLLDRCDSVYFGIDKKDRKFFNNLSIEKNLNKEVKEYVDYCITLQNEYKY